MGLLLERSVIQLLQFRPEILVELFQREILTGSQCMEYTAFQDAYSIFHVALHLGFAHFGRHDDRVIMLRPFSIILVQDGFNPILVRQHRLLAIVADDQGRNTAEITECVVVYCDSRVDSMPSA